MGGAAASSLAPMDRVVNSYPVGKFLAEGGFKRVYRVEHPAAKRVEAMSVLDLRQLRERGLDAQLGTELWVGYVLGLLRRDGVCPHFLELFRVFQCESAPEDNEWALAHAGKGSRGLDVSRLSIMPASDGAVAGLFSPPAKGAKARKGKKGAKKAEPPCFQYVMMEFAEGGDMEEAASAAKLMWPTSGCRPSSSRCSSPLRRAARDRPPPLRHQAAQLLPREAAAASSRWCARRAHRAALWRMRP